HVRRYRPPATLGALRGVGEHAHFDTATASRYATTNSAAAPPTAARTSVIGCAPAGMPDARPAGSQVRSAPPPLPAAARSAVTSQVRYARFGSGRSPAAIAATQ